MFRDRKVWWGMWKGHLYALLDEKTINISIGCSFLSVQWSWTKERRLLTKEIDQGALHTSTKSNGDLWPLDILRRSQTMKGNSFPCKRFRVEKNLSVRCLRKKAIETLCVYIHKDNLWVNTQESERFYHYCVYYSNIMKLDKHTFMSWKLLV